MKKNILLTISVMLIAIILSSCAPIATPSFEPAHSAIESASPLETETVTSTTEPSQSSEPSPVNEPAKIATMKLTAIGDVMSHYTQILDAYNAETGEYDYSNSLSRVKNFTKTNDLLIANLETSMAEGEYTGYPVFNTPPALAKNLKDIGVDIVSTANNHCLDKGFKGLVSTIEHVKAAGLEQVGTYATQEERDASNGVLVKEVNGISMAIVNYSYGTNVIRIPAGKEFSVNLLYEDYLGPYSVLNKEQISSDLEYARSLNTDLIIALIHWGTEYVTSENEKQREAAQFLFENGVDILIGNHAHVIQPMGMQTIQTLEGEEKEVFVCYALGNFMSNITRTHYTLTSVILNLYIEKDLETNITTIKGYDYVPLYMLTPEWGGSRFYVLPTHDALNEYEFGSSTIINEKIFQDLQESLKICHDILGRDYDYYYIKRTD